MKPREYFLVVLALLTQGHASLERFISSIPQAGAMPLLSSVGQRLDIWKALSKDVLVTAWENPNPATKSRQGSIKGLLLSQTLLFAFQNQMGVKRMTEGSCTSSRGQMFTHLLSLQRQPSLCLLPCQIFVIR